MSILVRDALDHMTPATGTSVTCAASAVAADASTEPSGDRHPHGRGLPHRSGSGCPCGCTFDGLTRRCIEPWRPPDDGNDLGHLYFG